MATFGKPTEQDAAQYPREFALYTLLDKKHDGKLDAQVYFWHCWCLLSFSGAVTCCPRSERFNPCRKSKLL